MYSASSIDFWRSAFSSAEIEVSKSDEGRRGLERERICARRKEVLRSIIVGAFVAIFVAVVRWGMGGAGIFRKRTRLTRLESLARDLTWLSSNQRFVFFLEI